MRVFQNLALLSQDARGTIRQLFMHDARDVQSILLITSNEGAVRSNHYHKKDSHYCYLLSGKAVWYERSVEGKDIERVVLSPGDMVYTPPMVVHAVKFLEDSLLLVLATELRDQEHYEDDTIRVELLS